MQELFIWLHNILEEELEFIKIKVLIMIRVIGAENLVEHTINEGFFKWLSFTLTRILLHIIFK